jgi:hypothetical protein
MPLNKGGRLDDERQNLIQKLDVHPAAQPAAPSSTHEEGA